MSEEFVKIEVDGKQLEARKGAMLIEVTDAAGIDVPRFCYHKKLSVAANCRMCLVEVEKAPKPLPACATPVVDGMKVYTKSAKTLTAQKGTMEFLLINHPLDCPICEQGGECELQDVAMGYGSDVSRYQERKRVVKDKDIGPLVATGMTRCIHCTRCVRFGEEIAGLRELGGTGRGEHTEIGTYVEKSMVSELSGNVIDLCPVGALMAKPSLYTYRSWELIQHPGIAPHDSLGSNIYLHTRRGKVMRVVPRENEAINEVWLSDRDRFGYQGIYSDDRVMQPLIKKDGDLQAVGWEEALETASQGLRAIIDKHGAGSVGFLISPTATLEEMYLAQKLARGLGIASIDHRLRQSDFSDQEAAPVYPWLGMPLAKMEDLNAALLVGSNIRMEQPLAGHRLRKAALTGTRVMVINPRDFDFRFPVVAKVIADPRAMIAALAAVARAVAELKTQELPDNLKALVEDVAPTETARVMAEQLVNHDETAVFLGNLAMTHPALSRLRGLAIFIARTSESSLGYLPEAANSAGGWLAGVLPHRLGGGKPVEGQGLDVRAMLESPRKAYVLIGGVEPEFDCWNPVAALDAINNAELVISLTPYANANARDYAQVILPMACFAETSGSYVNAEGRCQSFQAAAKPLGESRPGWKVLRVLGNAFQLSGFDYMDSRQVLDEVLAECAHIEPHNLQKDPDKFSLFEAPGLLRVADMPIYAVDAVVRRARALQQTPLMRPAAIYINPDSAHELGIAEASKARVRQQAEAIVLPLILDQGVPQGCVWIPAGLAETSRLGPAVGPVEITAA